MPGSPQEYNLLLFEDKQKNELVHIRAQKDYKLHALHNSYINIDNDQTEVVGNDESFLVKHDREKTIGHDEISHIQNDQKLTVDKNQSNHIKVSQDTKIDKDQILHVGNHRMETTYANHTLETGGNYKHTTNGKYDLTTGTHIKSTTKKHVLTASEKFHIVGKAGTITIDNSGIKLKGNVTIEGSLSVIDGKAPSVKPLTLVPNEGEGFDEKPKFFSEDNSVIGGIAYQLYSTVAQHNGASKHDGNAERVHTHEEEELEMQIMFGEVSASKKKCDDDNMILKNSFSKDDKELEHLEDDLRRLKKLLKKAKKSLQTKTPTQHTLNNLKKWYGENNATFRAKLLENVEEMIAYVSNWKMSQFHPGNYNCDSPAYAFSLKSRKEMYITFRYFEKRADDVKKKDLNNPATRLGHEFSHLLDWSAKGKQTNDDGGYHNIEDGNDISKNAQSNPKEAYMNADNFRYWLKGV
jgi:hypothetical protein